jgi:hypothetical protein
VCRWSDNLCSKSASMFFSKDIVYNYLNLTDRVMNMNTVHADKSDIALSDGCGLSVIFCTYSDFFN